MSYLWLFTRDYMWLWYCKKLFIYMHSLLLRQVLPHYCLAVKSPNWSQYHKHFVHISPVSLVLQEELFDFLHWVWQRVFLLSCLCPQEHPTGCCFLQQLLSLLQHLLHASLRRTCERWTMVLLLLFKILISYQFNAK